MDISNKTLETLREFNTEPKDVYAECPICHEMVWLKDHKHRVKVNPNTKFIGYIGGNANETP